MLIAGSQDGVHRMAGVGEPGEASAETVLDAGAVMRLRTFDAFDGAFAATETGLYHSLRGEEWTNLGVPREKVYAVAADPDGRLYAGTRPAHVYVARPSEADDGLPRESDWRELEGVQALPSREEWRLPRHENLAQVRDLHVHPAAPDRVVAGVEVGGVHVGRDRGEAWTERRADVDDVHELRVIGRDKFVAATGFGLFRTTDAGRSWTRLDEGYDQRYFRSVCAVGDTIYAAGALAHTATWDDADADPALFASRGGETIEPVEHPRPDETVTGMAAVGDALAAATHRGTVMVRDGDGWTITGSLPAPDGFAGSYTPLARLDR